MAGLLNAKAYLKKYRKRTIWHRALTCMAAVVVFCTTYALVLPAITLEVPTTCGMEEHTHTIACYADSGSPLLCNDVIEFHEHTDDCFDEDGQLICGYPDSGLHTHDDSCFDENGELVCGYADFVLHTHDKTCYSADGSLRCPLPEIKSYTVKRPKASGFLDGLFGGLLHADSTTGSALEYTPAEDTAQEEVEYEEVEITEPHIHDDSCYELEDGSVSDVPVCGLLEVYAHTHTVECFADEALTCGMEEHQHGEGCYLKYICGLEEHQHGETCYDAAGNLACGKEEHIHSDECKAPLLMNGLNLLLGASPRSTATLPVTAISGSGTTYDPDTGNFDTELNIDFAFSDKTGVQPGVDYVFTYPEGVLVPDSLLNIEKNLYDKGGKYAGKYTFVKDENGIYSVRVCFDPNYVTDANGKIEGFINFKGTLKTQTNANGDIHIDGGETSLDIDIPSEEIEYSGNETGKYDIAVEKQGSYVKDGDKLVYTVYVRSFKGTPDPISFQDVITDIDMDLGNPIVTVEQGTFRYYENNPGWNPSNEDWQLVNDIVPNCQEKNKITMSLPGLDVGTEKIDTNNSAYVEKKYYKITYSYDLSDKNVIQVSPKNTVTATAKDKTTNETVTDEKTVTVHIDKSYTISKGGQYDATTGRIKWTITINDKHNNLDGALLTDQMLGEISQGTNVDIVSDNTVPDNNGNGYTLERDADGNITGIRFHQINGAANTNRYTITYYTDAESGWDGQSVFNQATLDPTPDGTVGDEVSGETTVNTGGGKITKDCGDMKVSADKKTGEITWTVTVDVPASGLPAGTVIKDQMATGWNNTSKDQWMTRTQITQWASNLYWGHNAGSTSIYNPPAKNITFLASDGNTYTYEQISNNTSNEFEQLTYTVFEISFPDGLMPPYGQANQLSFTYTTTVDLSKAAIGDTKYYNYVEAGDKHDDAEYVYYKGGVVKMDGSDHTGTTQTSSDGTLTWKVKVIPDQQSEYLTVTDSLPQGVVLDSISVSGELCMNSSIDENGKITGSGSGYQVVGNYNSNTGVVVLTLTGDQNNPIKQGKNYTFTFTCHANGEQLEEFESGKTYTFTNSASAETNHGSLGSSEQTQQWTYEQPVEVTKILDKTGGWDNDNRRLNYSIVINPEGKDLVENADTLTLIDELQYNSWIEHWSAKEGHNVFDSMEISLIQNSVKLYKAVKDENGNLVKDENGKFVTGEPVNDWIWTYATKNGDNNTMITNTIKGTGIPDSTPLILEYAYSASSTIAKGSEVNMQVSNTAKLEGTSYSDTDNRNQDKWQDAQSSAGVNSGKSFTFTKVEAGNYNNALAGAEFSVYQFDSVSNVYGEDALKTYTTDEDGIFRIQWNEGTEESPVNQYTTNTLYKVIETKAPTGYKLPDPVQEYYFYFSDETDTSHTLPENIPASAIDLSKTDHTVYAENSSNMTSIEVVKQWFDHEKNPINKTGGFIEFDLYQIASLNPLAGSGDDGTKITYTIVDRYDSNKVYKRGMIENAVVGSNIEFTIGMNNANTYWQPTIAIIGATPTGGTWQYAEVQQDTSYYTGTAKVTEKEVVITVENFVQNVSPTVICTDSPTPDPEVPGESSEKGTKYREGCVVSAEGDWKTVISGLPMTGIDGDGNLVYYSYYVKETPSQNYQPEYENNDGIVSGTITISNTVSEDQVVLPNTGGPGVRAYTTAGLLLMMAAAVMLFYRKNMRRKEDSASS